MGARPLPNLDAPSRNGVPLAPNLRHLAEARNNLDLSDVRVHVGHEATHLGAAAFTTRSDIYLAPGNERLVGHELTHLIQQREQGGLVVPALAGSLVELNEQNSVPAGSDSVPPTEAAAVDGAYL
jgi:hypothetical protein